MSTNPSQITANWAAIRAVAPDRFDAYQRPNDKDELEAIARYVWNIEVSKALHPKLHVLEVAFRSQLHNALTVLHGQNWYDRPGVLQQKAADKVVAAKNELTRTRKTLTPGRIVASLTFGFWTELYGKSYDTTIGRQTIASVFPHYSGTGHLQRSQIAQRLNDARRLRNRVSHFEPIAFDPQLPRLHREISQLIDWMSPELAELSNVSDDLLLIYGKTWVAYRPIVETLFG